MVKKSVIKVPTTKEIQKSGRTTLTTEIKLKLNAALRKSYSPHLKDEFCLYKRLDEARLKKYGDYICYDILRIWKILRSKNKRFEKVSPKTIAKVIKHNLELEREDKKFEEKEMITGLTLVDIGFLTFEINGEWMLERIEKNLKDGIVAWAPIATIKTAIVDFPVPDIDSEKHADGVRSNYIRDTVVRMLEYSGVQVSGIMGNDQALLTVKKHFPEEQGFIRNKGESLFSTTEKSLREAHSTNVHEDVASLWFGIYKQKPDWIVYVTPVRQRDYIMKCFSAAEGYNEVKDSQTLMSYLGYQTSDDGQSNLITAWSIYKSFFKVQFDSYVEKDMMAYGYSSEEVFECFIKYAYLKTHKYSECKLDVRSLTQENNFVHLLNARKEIRSVIENSRSRDLFKLSKALVGKEREFGLHLLQFTEVIEKAFSTLMPHLLCDYLFKLCENFTSYNREAQLSKTWVLLCKAAEAVMEKGFDLLGITPKFSKALTSYLRPETDEAMAIRHYTPYPIPRKNTSSRFELFSMFIGVTPSDSKKDFETGQLFGHITVSDTCGLLKDGWSKLDRNGCGHVAHFVHDFDNSITIGDSGFIGFGNPSSRHAVAFSDSIKMGVHLYVTTTDKNACYELCSTD